jgi:hypothetical protein
MPAEIAGRSRAPDLNFQKLFMRPTCQNCIGGVIYEAFRAFGPHGS